LSFFAAIGLIRAENFALHVDFSLARRVFCAAKSLLCLFFKKRKVKSRLFLRLKRAERKSERASGFSRDGGARYEVS
jgi:hypothetical protein